MTNKKTQSVLEITDEVDFIRLNGVVYTMNKVGKCSLNSVIETAKSHFEQQANKHTEVISDEIVELVRTQEREQLEHLRQAQSSNACSILPVSFNVPFIAHHQGLQGYSTIRFTIWKPRMLTIGTVALAGLVCCICDEYRYSNNAAGFPEECFHQETRIVTEQNLFVNTPLEEQWRAMVLDIRANHVPYTILTNTFIPAQVLMSYFDGSNIRFIHPFNSNAQHHPHEISGGVLCTVGVNTNEFWNNPAYNQLLQPINCESLASRDFVYIDEFGSYQKWNIYKMLHKMDIISIAREEVTSWRTRTS